MGEAARVARPRAKTIVALLCLIGVIAIGAPAASAAPGSVSGRVTLPGGGPAIGFEVEAFVLTDGGEIDTAATTTDGDGEYFLDVPSGPLMVVWAMDPDPESNLAQTFYGGGTDFPGTFLDASQVHTGIDIEMVAGGSLTGTVTWAGDGPFTGRVEAGSRTATIEPDGTYRLNGVPPGEVFVTFNREAASSWDAQVYDFVTVVAGETTRIDATFAEHASPVQPVEPMRLADTRSGRPQGVLPIAKKKVGGANVLRLDLGLLMGMPFPWALGSEVAALSLNVTATGAAGGGYLTVHPCGAARPAVSSVNFERGQTVANAVIAPLDSSSGTVSDNEVCIYSSAPVDVIVDTNGWIPSGMGFDATKPARVMDTRAGKPQGSRSVAKAKVGPSNVVRVDLTGTAGIPEAGVAAASLNLTVADANGPGYLTAYACDSVSSPRPSSSSVNYRKGVVANAAIVPVAADGGVCLYSSAPVDVIVDANGWFSTDSGFEPVRGERLADTRPGRAPASTPKQRLNKDRILRVDVGIGVVAANLNITVVDPSSAGFVTVYPCDTLMPNSSNLNFVAGQTVANMAVSPVSWEGEVCVYSSASTDVIVDLNGTFEGDVVWPRYDVYL